MDAELTFEPNSTTLYSGEHVNLTCHMREANVSEWYYEFKWNDKPLVPITPSNVLRIPELTPDRNGDYQCIAHHNRSEESKQSNRATLSVSAHRPRATVRASRTSIPVGGSLTLTCSVEQSAGWSYDWFTRSPDAEETAIATNPVHNSLSISQGGSYWCRGRRTHSDFFSEKSHVHHIDRTLSNRSFVVLQHNWTQIFSGETISVRCEIQGGGDTQWEYEWRTTSSHQPVTGPNTAPTHSEYRLGPASVFHSGEYWCKARADWYSSTEWSEAFQLRVTRTSNHLSQPPRGRYVFTSFYWLFLAGPAKCDLDVDLKWSMNADKPRPRLTADDTTITGKGSVALTCSVENAAEWRYDWFRRTSASSAAQILRYNETDDEISISEEGIYSCRGRRGDTSFLTEDSNRVTIENRVSHKASVVLQPDWSLVFSGERITVRCELPADELTEVEYEWTNPTDELTEVEYEWTNPTDELTEVEYEWTNPTDELSEWEYEWTKPNSTTAPTHNEHRIVNVSSSDSGSYRCLAKDKKNLNSTTEWSDDVTLTVSERPAAQLSADHRAFPVGGSVLLTCSVGPASPGWKYYWYRGEKTSEPLTDEDFKSHGQSASASREGLYWCRGGRGDPVYYTQYSHSVRIHGIVHNRAAVTLQPNWPSRYRGEAVTLRCEIQGGDSEWEYEWTATSSQAPPNTKEFRISLGSDLSGSYWCQGRLKGAWQNSTGWSAPLTLSDAAAPPPVLTVSPSWLTPGASGTLTCGGVPHPTAGWRFYWYRAHPISLDPVPRCPQSDQYHTPEFSYELLPGSDGGTEQNSSVIQGLTESAGYSCRAGRGDPVFYTEYSETKWVWPVDSYSSVSLTVKPDSVQHFDDDNVRLTCEGNSDEWRLWMFTGEVELTECKSHKTMTSFSWNIYLPSGVFWCGSGSEISNAVNITRDSDRVLLESPAHPVTGGQSVTLSCSLFRRTNLDSSFFFYKNGELLQSDVKGKLEISAVSKSDEGFYKCEHSGVFSPESWMSVKYSDRVLLESPAHPVTEGVSVTLSCSWFGRKLDSSFSFYKNDELLQRDIRGKMEISSVSKSDEGSYKCEHSGVFSQESWMSVKYSDRVLLESPAHPVTEGVSVTLSCSWFGRKLDSSFSFYKNDELLQRDIRGKMEISAVSKSDEGFYKCEHSGVFSPESWMSVKLTPAAPPSASPVPLVVGLVGGFTLILLLSLLLLCWCRNSKNLCRDRLSQSLRTNQSSDPTVQYDEIQLPVYSSLLHGDDCIYDSIRGDTEEGTRGDP
ncbi:basement membrane-specific heparan sulfate proteoglycan core protein-like [Platichthys flesus]|uniref:basement membrane-specific heparan sulfate proteoglycan core protein-like n=1 Tax=Platichthys flesus TaxID=8260 RepID=UPI002DC01B27|nr:basement membrane-specific heparan sulfate proteoglycan core protein-like [Platichthys flesus]